MKNDTNKTVEVSEYDPLREQKKSFIAQMTANMLACSDNAGLARQSINNITALRVYHQMNSIIRYLDLMDKLEEKMYRSIEFQLDNMDEENQSTWMTLLSIQEKLQKNMIDSMKLLQPYMDMVEFEQLDVVEQAENIPTLAFDSATKDELRSAASNMIEVLKVG